MALDPPVYLQNLGVPAKTDRQILESFFTEGIVNYGDMVITSPSGLNYNMAAGKAYIKGDTNSNQGLYYVINKAAITSGLTSSAANPTNPRIDAVGIQLNDSAEVGSGSDNAVATVLGGTATAGATLANLNGRPSIPNSFLVLAYTLINASSTTVNGIGNLKTRNTVGNGAVAGAPPSYAYQGHPLGYVPAARWNGLSNGSIAAAGNADLQWTTESLDNDGAIAAGGTTWTCQTPGLYNFIGRVALSATATGELDIRYKLNGAAAVDMGSICNGAAIGNFNISFICDYGDTVVVNVKNNDSAGRTPNGGNLLAQFVSLV